MGARNLAASMGGAMAIKQQSTAAAPAPTPGLGGLIGAATSRWLRIILAVGLVVLLARTKAAPLAYLILIPAALFVGSPTMRASLDRWTTFWGGKPT